MVNRQGRLETQTKQLKQCCETIMENAEKIMEGVDMMRETEITIKFACNEPPVITVQNEFYSQKVLDDYRR